MIKHILLKILILRNFKGIKELTIDFSNITNIFGENATGKTTVFDAFTWLLFDKDSQDRTSFEIKTLDSNNNVLHGLEHEVSGTLEIDGRPLTLTKIYKEKWTKKRGEADKELTGHETLYYIDEVPVKKSEYQERINGIINEQLFKLISNPLYFSTNMKWQDRRKVLLDIIGDINTQSVINYKSDLKALEALLVDNDIDTLKKQISARKKRLNDDIRSIPYRVDECNNSIHELDFDALEFQKRTIVGEIKYLEDKIIDSSKVNEEILKDRNLLNTLRYKLKDIENYAKVEAEAPLKQLNNALTDIKFELNSKENELVYKEKDIQRLTAEISKHETRRDELKKQWYEEDAKQFEFDESKCICPTCKRAYETEDIERTKQELQENFNENKASNLKAITKTGQIENNHIAELKGKLDDINLDALMSEIAALKTRKEKLEYDVFNFEPVLKLDDNHEYQETLKQIEELEVKLQQPSEVNSNVMDLKAKKNELQRELDDINRQLAQEEQNKKLKVRIAELQEEEKNLAQQIAALEGQEFLCEEYIKSKVELLESSINSKFKYVSFKLFDTQVNGGINECCEALINGVPFSNANTASQINAGMDIINSLCSYYGVQAPIFIDNRESVNQLLDTESQVINLIVSKDKPLRIESEVM